MSGMNPAAVTRISHDVLMLIFEHMLDLRKDPERPDWNTQLFNVLLVCRQWNVRLCPFPSDMGSGLAQATLQATAFPMVFRDIAITSHSAAIRLVALLKVLEARGCNHWPSIRRVWVGNLRPFSGGSWKEDGTRYLLTHAPFLTHAELTNVPFAAVDALSKSCRRSLRSLHVHNSMRDISDVRRFRWLRKLKITIDRMSIDPYSALRYDDVGWSLPELEHLHWAELQQPWVSGVGHHAIRFLTHCRFPKLRQASLHINLDEIDSEDGEDEDESYDNDGGPDLLSNFLTAHRTIDELSITVTPDMYERALPAVTSSCLSLQGCGTISPSLFRLLPPSVTILKLPVYVTEDDGGGPDPEVPVDQMLGELLLSNTNVKEVHLSIGHIWDRRGHYDNYLPTLPFYFARETETPYDDILEEIFPLAVKLQERGITVHDERGSTLHDAFIAGSTSH
jgi:hypothetical protein